MSVTWHDYDAPSLELISACATNDVREVEQLLRLDGDPCKVAGRLGETPLHLAADHKLQVLKALLTSGKVSDVNVLSADKLTPLMVACEKGFLEGAKLLVQHGADPTLKHCQSWNVLHFSIRWHKTDLVKQCLKWKGVNVNEIDAYKRTPLMLSAMYGYSDIVQVLLTAGADVNVKDMEGLSALYYAKCHNDVTQLLMKQKNLSQETKNMAAAQILIKNEIDVLNVDLKNILQCIEKTGFRFRYSDLKDLSLIADNDFSGVLQLIDARKLIRAFTENFNSRRMVMEF